MYYKNAGPIHVPAVIGNEKEKKKKKGNVFVFLV